MIDRTPPPPGTVKVPTFESVPRKTNRHDGWTPERQRGFIAALIETGSVKTAAHAVNMTPMGAYLLRRNPKSTSYSKAWVIAHGVGRKGLRRESGFDSNCGWHRPRFMF